MSGGVPSLLEGMTEGWGVGALLMSGLGSWSSQGKKQHVPWQGHGPCWQEHAVPQALWGSPGGGQSLQQFLPGTLLRSCCSQWGKASPGDNRCRLVACLGGQRSMLGVAS